MTIHHPQQNRGRIWSYLANAAGAGIGVASAIGAGQVADAYLTNDLPAMTRYSFDALTAAGAGSLAGATARQFLSAAITHFQDRSAYEEIPRHHQCCPYTHPEQYQ